MSECYLEVARMLPEGCLKVSESCPKVASRHKHRNGHVSSPCGNCDFLERAILHRMLVRTFSWARNSCFFNLTTPCKVTRAALCNCHLPTPGILMAPKRGCRRRLPCIVRLCPQDAVHAPIKDRRWCPWRGAGAEVGIIH